MSEEKKEETVVETVPVEVEAGPRTATPALHEADKRCALDYEAGAEVVGDLVTGGKYDGRPVFAVPESYIHGITTGDVAQ